MRDPNRKIVILQWCVIAVLVIGAAVGGYMLYNENNQLQAQQDAAKGNVQSLQNQLKQAKTSPTPTVDPLPEASGNVGTPAPTPTPTATPKPTTTPKTQQ